MDDFASPNRRRLNDPDLLQPWECLLLLINRPGLDPFDLTEALRLALPYCKETIEQRNERLRLEAEIIEKQQPPPMTAPFDFGKLTSAKDILRAQRKVMASLGEGLIPTDLAHRYIAMLDALRKSHADVITEDRLLDYEETRKQVEADQDRAS